MSSHSPHIRPLTLPTLRTQHAHIRSMLATGLVLPFIRDGAEGRLHLQLTNECVLAEESFSAQPHDWRSDIGDISLTDPFPVLSLLSDCPLLPLSEDNDAAQEWYWTLYNQSLNPVLRALVGEIYPLGMSHETPHGMGAALSAWLSVSWNGITARSRMQAADAVWLALFSRAGWHRQRRTLPGGMTIALPIILADAVVPLPALHHLRTGDLILPNRPWFTPAGEGTLSSGTLRLHGTLQLTAHAPYTFTITDMETLTMPSPATDTMFVAPHSDAAAFPFTQEGDNVTESLPPLPVTLHLRCGSLTMTLTELQHLASGSVFTLRDVVPGQAWLYYGDIALASGDLVDVEGRLGLQITHRFTAQTRFSASTQNLPAVDEDHAADPELAP
ncbi:type III secretion system cytoplasmic ring protein SctQ [Pectobacterium cacticida]|uniref:type III secretion system cytoplasmic ring protein SctQ n=1 Tax=Pectobacterium cacticida TaxID=69221 RepID=UPI002FF42C0E